MKIQDYLRTPGNSPETLKEELGIKYRRHSTIPRLISFKYHQCKSPRSHQIVIEARGLILDELDNWEVVARPFDRFFNYDEFEVELDWKYATITEKVDGSLMFLYNYGGLWYVASSSIPDASGPVHSTGDKTFADLFWDAWGLDGGWIGSLSPQFTYIFELTSPENRVVIPHLEPSLTLLAVRSKGGQYMKYGNIVACRSVRHYRFPSMDELQDYLIRQDPMKIEGFVVSDGSNRVKVKHPGYKLLHSLIMSVEASDRTVTRIAKCPETLQMCRERLGDYPEVLEKLESRGRQINRLVCGLLIWWEFTEDIKSQKEFASKVLDSRIPGALFKMRQFRPEDPERFLRQYIGQMRDKKLTEILETI